MSSGHYFAWRVTEILFSAPFDTDDL